MGLFKHLFKKQKATAELYEAITEEIISLVRFKEHLESVGDVLPEQELGRLKAFRDIGLFIVGGKDWKDELN